MKNRLKLIRMIEIMTGIFILIIFIQMDNKIKKINEINNINISNNNSEFSDALSYSNRIVTMSGEIIEVYDKNLILKSVENSLLYEASIPQTELLKNWELGDIVTVSYNGRQLDTSPARLLGVISIKNN